MYVINLKHKLDRLILFREAFKDALPDGFRILRWDAIRDTRGWKGCLMSHVQLMNYLVRHRPADLYMILEDDCCLAVPKVVFRNVFPKYLSYLKQHMGEWDIFITGGIGPEPVRIVCQDPFIIECNWIVCSQFNIHSNVSAKRIIEYGNHPERWKETIDTYMAQQHRGKIWIPYPMLSGQTGVDSCIGSLDYLDMIQTSFTESKKILDDFVMKNTKTQ